MFDRWQSDIHYCIRSAHFTPFSIQTRACVSPCWPMYIPELTGCISFAQDTAPQDVYTRTDRTQVISREQPAQPHEYNCTLLPDRIQLIRGLTHTQYSADTTLQTHNVHHLYKLGVSVSTCVCVFFTLTDRASTIPSRQTDKSQSSEPGHRTG